MYRLRPSGDWIGQPSTNGVFSSELFPAISSAFWASAQAESCLSCASCRDCHLCETICPTGAITRRELEYGHTKGYETGLNGGWEYTSDDRKCIACGFCADTCPCGIWMIRTF